MELTNTSNRPWQGTALGVVNTIGLVMAFTMLILMLFGGSFLAGFMDDEQMTIILGLGALAISLFMIPFLILGVFITIGVFKGQRWTIIVMLIFTAIALLSGLSNLFSDGGYHAVGSLIVNGFVLYCEIVSLKDPFYK